MYRKNCDQCYQPSFSSSEFGEWICPICGKDLTKFPYFPAMLFERIEKNIANKRKITIYDTQYKKACQ